MTGGGGGGGGGGGEGLWKLFDLLEKSSLIFPLVSGEKECEGESLFGDGCSSITSSLPDLDRHGIGDGRTAASLVAEPSDFKLRIGRTRGFAALLSTGSSG